MPKVAANTSPWKEVVTRRLMPESWPERSLAAKGLDHQPPPFEQNPVHHHCHRGCLLGQPLQPPPFHLSAGSAMGRFWKGAVTV